MDWLKIEGPGGISYEERAARARAGHIQIVASRGRLRVFAPYHEDMVKQCRELGGRWHKYERFWEFSATIRVQVLEMLEHIFKVESKGFTKCAHKMVQVDSPRRGKGIQCMFCGLFKDRSV